MGRVNIAADSELIKELEKEAKSRGYTIFSLTNLALRAMLEMIRMGEDSTKLQELVELHKIFKDLDVVPITSWYIESLAKLAYEKDQKAFQTVCEGAGLQVASYLKSRASTLEELIVVYENVKSVLPIKDLKVKKIEDDEFEVRLTGTGFSLESTFCASMVFKKVLESYGFTVLDLTPSPGGIIYAKAKFST
ncbi:hypothetical protein GWK48_08525 [Metallosphaera tengchongensis]|uniref:Uncharacterized protein n=1 Tax=Metallosphaera tengchongensis TaxID=1532350 RepID=A0A6N0NZA4_9CREN|nr:hypothetical protein [Metallosphaera tengchongensis]QKR00410.1 hypothetical protein GWK48_08525 [Metallosphaera tengchongensis]